jgi:large subunit ribosomal protein L15
MFNLKRPKNSVKKPKRVGRGVGSGHGSTATRGTKGQKARAGAKKKPGFEGGQMPITRRIPKRGFSSTKPKPQIVNIKDLNRFSKNSVVNRETLYEIGLIKKKRLPVKVLAKGELKIPLTVEVDNLSARAKEAIIACGGKVV